MDRYVDARFNQMENDIIEIQEQGKRFEAWMQQADVRAASPSAQFGRVEGQ